MKRITLIMDVSVSHAETVWPTVAKVLCIPHDDAEYERSVNTLDQLIDLVGEDESHPLASLVEITGVLIKQYEDDHIPGVDEP